MAYELKDGQGSMFVRDKKKNPKEPDFSGSFKINGTVYEIAGWKKQSDKGQKFLSLSVKPKEEQKPNDGW